MSKYAGFRVVLDTPTAEPVLGFDDYASALYELIQTSRPEFSVGIFGSWGSGKTSLMQAIRKKLERDDKPGAHLITVWFNPWRYEKEEHLIVPMLDTLREAIIDWSKQQPPGLKERATKAASTIGRAARAILAGVSMTAKLPVFEATVDPGRVIGAWRQEGIDDPLYAHEPQSFYHASFVAMRGALSQFFTNDVMRVVIFVDDLDRCLPEKALEVLESMKLFFDLEGCVFVVGLDQAVIERAVAEKYQARTAAADERRNVSGSEYVKKIFQVPFGVPPIRPQQLEEYLRSIASSADLSSEQNVDLVRVVGPHLSFLAKEQSLNPREVKRFINAYTLQVKMLEPRLGQTLNPDAVLAVQAMTFRADWRDLYKQLVPDPQAFRDDLDAALQDGYWPDRKRTPVPASFAAYVHGAGAVIRESNLEEYIASVEATHFTDTSLLEISKGLRELWRAWGTIGEEDESKAAGELQSALMLLGSHATRHEGSFSENLSRKTEELSRQVARLQQGELKGEALTGWRERFSQVLESIESDVDERRRQTSVGGTA